MSTDKRGELYTPELPITWSYLRQPDEAFNAKKHAVQVVVTPEMQELCKERFGISDWSKDTVAGMYRGTENNDIILTVKTTEFTKKNEEVYGGPIVDAKGQKLDGYYPTKGDTARLKCWVNTGPSGKLGFWLNGIQVIEQNGSGGGGGNAGWDDMSGGDNSAAPATEAPAASNDDSKDLPF